MITNDRFPSAQTCEESRILYRCLIFSLLYGGFATTILRMLFITRPNLVQRFDKKNIAIAVLLFWQLCLITTIIAYTKYVKLIPVLFFTSLPLLTLTPLIAILELTSNLYVGYFIYKRDSTMEQFLSAASTKRRRQKAAINFLGYITHFAMEFTTIPVAIIMITNGMAPLMAYIYLYPVLSLTGMIFNKPIQEELTTTSQFLLSRFMSSVERLMGKFRRQDSSLHPEVMKEETP